MLPILASFLLSHAVSVRPTSASPMPASAFARKLNSFGRRLWLAQGLRSGNEAVAPISVGICLTMLIDGANEPTHEQLLRTLGLEGDVSIDAEAKAFADSLRRAGDQSFT